MASWTNPNLQPVVVLTSQGSVSGTAAGTVPAAGSFTVMTLVNVTQFTSYDLNSYMFAVTPGNAGSPVVANIQLQWFDDLTSNVPVFEEDWWVWVGRAAPTAGINTLSGSGPMHGQYMSVTVTIPVGTTTGVTLQYINIYGSGRVVPRSDWRQYGQQVNPQINALIIAPGAGGSSFDNILANISAQTVNTGTTSFVACGLYSGSVWWRFQASAAPAADPVILSPANTFSGSITFGTAQQGVLVNITPDANEHEGQIIAPRAPIMFVIRGPAAGMLSYSFWASGQQF